MPGALKPMLVTGLAFSSREVVDPLHEGKVTLLLPNTIHIVGTILFNEIIWPYFDYSHLSAPDVEYPIAVMYSRFGTNTFPSWERAPLSLSDPQR